jgi:hypothetical protein
MNIEEGDYRMDFVTAIGLISSFVTIEEAGRSWISIFKDI